MSDKGIRFQYDDLVAVLVRAARAGIQTAWESWEPDDYAPVPEVPAPLAGVIEVPDGGVFRNAQGDYLVEPIGDETGELILVRADGTTATLRGDWETGWEA